MVLKNDRFSSVLLTRRKTQTMQRIGEALQRRQRPGGKVSNYKTTSRWLQLNFDAYTPAGVEYIRCSTPAGVADQYRHFSPNAIRGYLYSTAIAVLMRLPWAPPLFMFFFDLTMAKRQFGFIPKTVQIFPGKVFQFLWRSFFHFIKISNFR